MDIVKRIIYKKTGLNKEQYTLDRDRKGLVGYWMYHSVSI